MRPTAIAALLGGCLLVATPARAQRGVELRLAVDGSPFTTHDELALRLEVHNGSGRSVQIVAPVYGSWEHAREPAYDTVFTDASTGEVVEDALGYEDGLECGVLDPIRPQDRITVPSRGTRAIPMGAGSTQQHRVLASARPGTYAMRVRYRSGARTLLSNPVTIRVVGGDLALWECRRQQLAALTSFRSVQSAALGAAPLAGSGHTLLAFTRQVHDASSDARETELWVVALDARLQPAAPPARLFASRELGYPPALAATSRGVLVAAIHDARGTERPMLREVRWEAGALVVGPEQILPRGGGLAVSMSGHGDRAWLLHGDLLSGPLRLWRLDASGAPLGPAIEAIPEGEHTGGGWVEADATGAWVVERARPEQRLVALRYDASGARVARTPPLPMGGAATAVRASADQLEIVWQDSSFEGSDPADGMGLVYGAVRLDGGSLASRALSPIDRQDPRWGRAAWSGDRLGFAYAESSRAVVFGTDAVRQTLSSSGSQVQLAVIVGGWLATWNDVRNDGSPSCRELSQCATEVYAARIDDRGRVTVGATRITSDAVPAPPRPSQRDWPRLCH